MRRNWVIAGISAGVLAFFLGAFLHMAVGLGDSSFQQIPDETAAMAALGSKITKPGLYMFPYMNDMERIPEAFQKNPHGLVVFTPAGDTFNLGKNLAIQLVTDIGCGLLLAWLILRLRPAGAMDGLLYGVVAGLFVTLASLAPYWNWYSFPSGFILAGLAEQVIIAGMCGGLIGWMLAPGQPELVRKAAHA